MNRKDYKIKEKRKSYISNTTTKNKILIYLGIMKVWYEPRDGWEKNLNDNFGWFRCEKINIYNPITWLMVLLLMPFMAVAGMADIVNEVIKKSKVSRYG